MKKYLLMLVMVFTCVQASAASYIETDGLTEKQKAELALKMAEMKEGSAASTVTKAVAVNDAAAEGVLKWGTVSTEIAKGLVVGLAAAAKEANIAVNEFSQTPVGKITTVIIVWKMIGQDLASLVAGFMMIFLGCPALWYIYQRLIIDKQTFEHQPRLWGLYHRKVIVSTTTISEGDKGGLLFFYLAGSVVCVIAGIILIV